ERQDNSTFRSRACSHDLKKIARQIAVGNLFMCVDERKSGNCWPDRINERQKGRAILDPDDLEYCRALGRLLPTQQALAARFEKDRHYARRGSGAILFLLELLSSRQLRVGRERLIDISLRLVLLTQNHLRVRDSG